MKYGRLTVVYEYPINLNSYSNSVQASQDYERAIQEDLECLKEMSFSVDDLDADAQYVKAEVFEKEEAPVAEMPYEEKLDEDERRD